VLSKGNLLTISRGIDPEPKEEVMRPTRLSIQFMLLVLLNAGASALGQGSAVVKPSPKPTPKATNAVCPDPARPCRTKQKEFGEWELSFRLPARIRPNVTYKSAPFYAIILKTYSEGCDELDANPKVEPERLRIQRSYPTRKVFAEYSCPNLDAASYDFAGKTNASGESLYTDYIAIYAGETADEANRLLNEIKAKFPKAAVKRMTATWSQSEQ
jgi:hypothetical protein